MMFPANDPSRARGLPRRVTALSLGRRPSSSSCTVPGPAECTGRCRTATAGGSQGLRARRSRRPP
jgi:hypothetical protein